MIQRLAPYIHRWNRSAVFSIDRLRRDVGFEPDYAFRAAVEHTYEWYRAEGLFEAEEVEPEEADDLRLAQVLMEELGVNAAGVEVALHLRKRLLALEERARALAEVLESSQIGRAHV
mgnify:CR=1 FL=1